MKCDVTLVYDGEMSWIDNYDMPFRIKYNVIGIINGYRVGWAHFNIGVWKSEHNMSKALSELIIEMKKQICGRKSRYELRFCPIDGNGIIPLVLDTFYEKAGIGSIIIVFGENNGWT